MKILGIVACALLVVSLGSPKANGTNDGKAAETAKDFVQEFYNWYVPIALSDNAVPASDIALKQRRTAFSLMLFRALKADSEAEAKAKGYVVGIDFDPFLASQDPCERYEVGRVSQKGSGYWVGIYDICSGKRNEKPDVVAEVARRDGSWAFTNFFYPAIHRDLLDTLRTLRDERHKSSR